MNYEDYTHHNHHSGFGEYQGYLALPFHHDGKEDVGNVDLKGAEYPIGLCLKDDLYMMLKNKISTNAR